MAPRPRAKAARATVVRKEIAGWLLPIVERERERNERERESFGGFVEREWSVAQVFGHL